MLWVEESLHADDDVLADRQYVDDVDLHRDTARLADGMDLQVDDRPLAGINDVGDLEPPSFPSLCLRVDVGHDRVEAVMDTGPGHLRCVSPFDLGMKQRG